MATLSELNIGLAELQTELENLKNFTSQINEAKETAILSTDLSKKILEDYASIVNSVNELIEKLKSMNLPLRFETQNENINIATEAIKQNDQKLNRLNDQYLSIFNSNNTLINEINVILNDIKSGNEKISKINSNIESIRLDSLVAGKRSTNQFIINLVLFIIIIALMILMYLK